MIIKRALLISFLLNWFIALSMHNALDNFDYLIRSYALADDVQAKLYTKDVYKNQDKLCVSLGFNCTSAFNLEKNELRKKAFPFD